MILIFLIAMGADYSFELIFIVHGVPQFIGHNKIFLGSVTFFRRQQKCGQIVLFVHCGSLQKIHIDIYVLMSLGPAIHKGRPH